MSIKVADWSTTPASNSSVDGVAISENVPFANMNNMGRAIMSAVKYEVASFGTVVAAATKPDIAIEGGVHSVSGTTSITGFATAPAGLRRTLIFETAVPLIHGTNLVIPGSANFTTSAGTVVHATSGGSGYWSLEISRRDGKAIVAPSQCIGVVVTPDTSAVAAGAGAKTFRMPFAFTITDVRASLATAQTGGNIFTVDINESGSTILSTKITIDNGEKTSETAVTAPVVSDTALTDDAEITIDVDQIGDGTAKGLTVYIIGRKSS